MLERIKSSISLKIALLGFVAFIITEVLCVTTQIYFMDLLVMLSICLCAAGLIFFLFAYILDILGRASKFFMPIFVFVYLTLLAYFLNYIVKITFLASFDMIVLVMEIVWKLFVCATAVLIFVKIALLVFGKQKIINNCDVLPETGKENELHNKE